MPVLQKSVQMVAGRLPKIIGPNTHALLDYAVAGSFLLMGAIFWRRNKRAALSSLVCGGAAAANILLTDYPGGALKAISYKQHGSVDAGLAGATAALPGLMGFSDEPEARFFGFEAVAETALVGLTDYDYYEDPPKSRRRRGGDPEESA